MSDYIRRKAASVVIEGEQKKLCPVGLWGRKFAADADKYDMLQEMLEKLEAIPAADVEPVRHGRWISLTDCSNAGVYCSIYHKKVYKEDYAWCNRKNKVRSPYCPNCGSKMDLEDETNDD